jgi:ATP-dependent exoDNAse (exonuclease V) beta subunit
VRTATSLKPEWAAAAPGEDDIRRGRAAEFGTAVHALIERTALRADRIDALAPVVATEYGYADRVDEMRTIARRALASNAVARALRSPRMLLEAPFTAPLPPGVTGLAEGRIDLLFEEDGAIVIVDFKTDAVTPRDVDARTEHYRNQALVYAWAVTAATRMSVREVIFLYARAALERSFPVDDAFLSEADALMRSPIPED